MSRALTFAVCICTLAYPWSAMFVSAQDRFRDPSPHRVTFVSVGKDRRLEVLDWGGAGRPIILLAGYLTAHVYDDLAPKLSSSARVYGITRRGLGASSKPDSGYAAADSASDVIQVLDALKITRPVLVGHSFGGQDLSYIGASYPQRVAGLVYLDSAEDTSLEPIDGLDPAKLPERLRVRSRPDMRSYFAYQQWQKTNLGGAFPEAELRQLFGERADGSLGEYQITKQVRDAMFAGLTPPRYDRIRAPVLALFALPLALEEQAQLYQPQNNEEAMALGLKYGLDLARFARQRDLLKKSIPKARIVEIPGASPYIFVSHPEVVLREIRAFVAGL